MTQLFTNNASGTLSVQAEIIDTTLTLQVNEGQLFPNPTGGDFFRATLEDTSGNVEIVNCTANGSDILTVTRAAETTTAKVFPTGSKVELRPTADHDSFLQVFGGVMQGELDMNNEQLTDPLIVGGEIRNTPLRGSDGGTANEIIVPTSAGPPTLGGNNILHAGTSPLVVFETRTFTGGEGIATIGDLTTDRTVDLAVNELATFDAGDLAGDDDFLVYDTSATEHKRVAYQDGGVRVVIDSGTTITPISAQNNSFFVCTAATAIAFDVDIGVGKAGNFFIIKQDNIATVTIGGSATVTSAIGTTTRVQNSILIMLCEDDSDNWTLYGDGGG